MSRNPKLRDDVVIRKIDAAAEPYVMVKRPGPPASYYEFKEWEGQLVALLDGSRTCEEIAEDFGRIRPELGVDSQYVADFVEGLGGADLLEKSEQERQLAMMDQAKTFRKKRFYNAETSSLFQIHIPLFDPNNAMDRILPWIRWWWSPWFVIPWLVVFTFVLGYLVYQWDVYWASFFGMFDPRNKTPLDWVVIIGIMFATGMWHELGHGFTCKRFGGEVHDIGIMIFYLEPAFYCRTDDSYMIPKRWNRIAVSFGGAFFELMVCSFALLVWLFTPPEWWLHDVALIEVLFTGLSLVLFNCNPLIKLDGYYALMDIVQVPDLREESFAFIGNLLKKHLLHMDVEEKAISRRRRRIYVTYGTLSMLYTSTIMLVIFLFLESYLVGWFGPLGYLLLAGLVLWALRQRIRDGVRFMKHFWLDKKDVLRSPKGAAITSAIVLAIALLLTLPVTPTRVEARFVVEPGDREVVRAGSPGTIRTVLVTEGERVREGTPLALLENPDLEAEHQLAEARLARARREAARAKQLGDPALESEWRHAAREAEGQVEILGEKISRLSVNATRRGVVTTPRVEEKTGTFLEEGEELCTVDSYDSVRLAASAPEIDVEEIARGSEVRLLAEAWPGRTIRAQVLSVAPVAVDPSEVVGELPDVVRRSNLVRILVEVENPGGLLRPGMSGRAQFLTLQRSPAAKALRGFHRWASAVFW